MRTKTTNLRALGWLVFLLVSSIESNYIDRKILLPSAGTIQRIYFIGITCFPKLALEVTLCNCRMWQELISNVSTDGSLMFDSCQRFVTFLTPSVLFCKMGTMLSTTILKVFTS